MMVSRRVVLMVGLLAVASWAAPRREALLAPSQGQIPSDTASDGQTKFAMEDVAALGGRALKVIFAPGDTFGDRMARVTNWKPFTALEFAALNPSQADVALTLVIRHQRTAGFPTRVDVPFVLKPGRNDVSLPIGDMTNTNGSAPDLAHVLRWYVATAEGQAPTLYFTDMMLVGAEAEAAPAPAPGGAGYHVTGKIGEATVDLVVTPLGLTAVPVPTAGARPAAPAIDPARLARIRAAVMPAITEPVLFNTPQADAICSALEIFPPDNPWNQLVTDWPVPPNSKAIVASVGLDKPLRYNADMAFILVPPNQPRLDVALGDFPGESDKGPYPLPPGVPIEGWPAGFKRDPALASLTLDDVQRDVRHQDGDRHASVVDPVNRMLYEFYQLRHTATGWRASQASIFDLKSNALRPLGWTSTDAAGLPLFPAIVRYDELKRGVIDHALRVTILRSQRAFVAPATHYASALTDPNLPRMGERFRLRADFDVSGFSPEARTILMALKRYGMMVADNGIEWALSVAPDERIPVLHEELRKVKGSDFEVVTAP